MRDLRDTGLACELGLIEPIKKAGSEIVDGMGLAMYCFLDICALAYPLEWPDKVAVSGVVRLGINFMVGRCTYLECFAGQMDCLGAGFSGEIVQKGPGEDVEKV